MFIIDTLALNCANRKQSTEAQQCMGGTAEEH